MARSFQPLDTRLGRKALPSFCGITSCCLADDDYVAASSTSLEASSKSYYALALLFFFLYLVYFWTCHDLTLMLGFCPGFCHFPKNEAVDDKSIYPGGEALPSVVRVKEKK
jgi:hypothetical protein